MTSEQFTEVSDKLTGAVEITQAPVESVVNESVVEQPETPVTLPVDSVTEEPAVSENTNNGTSAELDKTGLPWDERIHSSNRKKTSKGVWTRRRGVQDFEFNKIAEELKAGQSAETAPAVAPVAPQPPVTPVAIENGVAVMPNATEVTAEGVVPPVTPVAPQPPVQAPVSPPVPTEPVRDFKTLMQQISQLFQTQQIEPNYPDTIISRVNEGFNVDLKTITDIANDDRMVDYAWQCLEVDGKAV